MPELAILIGLQASGKSTFARHRLASHRLVSRDLFPNAHHPSRRQEREVEAALLAGVSVVIDNTNPTVQDRAILIAQARRHGVSVVGYYFRSTVADCIRRNEQREGKARVPEVAIFSTIKRLAPPSLEEGFDQLTYVELTDAGEFRLSAWQQEAP